MRQIGERKAILASSLIGSATGIIIESLPSSAIDDDTRDQLRILTAVMQIPEAGLAVKDIGKGIISKLRKAKSTASAADAKKIEDLAVELEKKLDAAAVAAASKWLDELPAALKTDIESTPELRKLFEEATDAGRKELTEAWTSLSSFSGLRKIQRNLEILVKISRKFEYNEKIGFGALTDILKGHVSAQKFIDNLEKADDLLGSYKSIVFSGIKSSSETRLISNGDEIVRLSGSNLHIQNKGWIDVLAPTDEIVSVPPNYEIYSANGDIFTGEVKIVKSQNGKISFNYGNKNNIPFINGKTAGELKRTPKYSRPKQPETYLSSIYISNHLKLFENEGGAFIAVKTWLETGKYSEFPLKKYVMLNSDMKKAISEYRTSNNLEGLEDALGYRRGDLKGFENEIYVFYVDKSKYRFEMPNGNEDGANIFWEPGGKTSGGSREAVIIDIVDPKLQINHGKNIENLKGLFTFEKLQ